LSGSTSFLLILNPAEKNNFNMGIQYKVVKKAQPGVKGGGAYRYHAAATGRKIAGTRELSRMLAERCTVRPADVKAVLTGLADLMAELLIKGQSVQFDEIGIFSTSLISELKNTPEEVKESTISGVRIQFRADKNLKKQMSTTSFQKVRS
jgi:predicted histone-like DNA-binding protein